MSPSASTPPPAQGPPSLLLATFGQPLVAATHPTHEVPLVSGSPNGYARRRPETSAEARP
jgi:hypothetical protein